MYSAAIIVSFNPFILGSETPSFWFYDDKYLDDKAFLPYLLPIVTFFIQASSKYGRDTLNLRVESSWVVDWNETICIPFRYLIMGVNYSCGSRSREFYRRKRKTVNRLT